MSFLLKTNDPFDENKKKERMRSQPLKKRKRSKAERLGRQQIVRSFTIQKRNTDFYKILNGSNRYFQKYEPALWHLDPEQLEYVATLRKATSYQMSQTKVDRMLSENIQFQCLVSFLKELDSDLMLKPLPPKDQRHSDLQEEIKDMVDSKRDSEKFIPKPSQDSSSVSVGKEGKKNAEGLKDNKDSKISGSEEHEGGEEEGKQTKESQNVDKSKERTDMMNQMSSSNKFPTAPVMQKKAVLSKDEAGNFKAKLGGEGSNFVRKLKRMAEDIMDEKKEKSKELLVDLSHGLQKKRVAKSKKKSGSPSPESQAKPKKPRKRAKTKEIGLGFCIDSKLYTSGKLSRDAFETSRRLAFKGLMNLADTGLTYSFTLPSSKTLKNLSIINRNARLSLQNSSFMFKDVDTDELNEMKMRKQIDKTLIKILQTIVYEQNLIDDVPENQTVASDRFEPYTTIFKDVYCLLLRCASFEIVVDPFTTKQSKKVFSIGFLSEIANILTEFHFQFGIVRTNIETSGLSKDRDYLNIMVCFPMIYNCTISPFFVITIKPLPNDEGKCSFRLISITTSKSTKETFQLQASLVDLFFICCDILGFEGDADLTKDAHNFLKIKKIIKPSVDKPSENTQAQINYSLVENGDKMRFFGLPQSFIKDYQRTLNIQESKDYDENSILERTLILTYEALQFPPHRINYIGAFKSFANRVEGYFKELGFLRDNIESFVDGLPGDLRKARTYITIATKTFDTLASFILNPQKPADFEPFEGFPVEEEEKLQRVANPSNLNRNQSSPSTNAPSITPEKTFKLPTAKSNPTDQGDQDGEGGDKSAL